MPLNFGIEPPRWLTQEVSWLGSDERIQKEREEFRKEQTFPLEIQKLQLGLATEGLRQQSEAIGLQESRLKLTEQARELAEWEKDSKNVIPWLTATPEQRRSLPPPAPTSNKGIALVTQVQKADDVNAIKQQLADNQIERTRLYGEAEAAKIQQARDKLAADQAIEAAKRETTIKVEQIRAQNRLEVQNLRNLSRTDAAGRQISQTEYVNRHLNNVMKDLRVLDVDNKKTTEEITREAQAMLIRAYGDIPGTPAGAAAATNKAPFKIGRFLVTPQ